MRRRPAAQSGAATPSSRRSGSATGAATTPPGRLALDDPHVSPAYADLAGLPPLYLPVGPVRHRAQGVVALAEAALAAGVDVTTESWPGTVHGWQGLVSAGVPEAEAWFVRARDYLDARVPPR